MVNQLMHARTGYQQMHCHTESTLYASKQTLSTHPAGLAGCFSSNFSPAMCFPFQPDCLLFLHSRSLTCRNASTFQHSAQSQPETNQQPCIMANRCVTPTPLVHPSQRLASLITFPFLKIIMRSPQKCPHTFPSRHHPYSPSADLDPSSHVCCPWACLRACSAPASSAGPSSGPGHTLF